MRSFCQQAARIESDNGIHFFRAVPLNHEDTQELLLDSDNLTKWLPPVDLSAEDTADSVRTDERETHIAISSPDSEGSITLRLTPKMDVALAIEDLAENAIARRQLPHREGPAAGLTLSCDGSRSDASVLGHSSSIDIVPSVQPGGVGTTSVVTCAAIHQLATQFQKYAFERSGSTWPEEWSVNLDVEPLLQCYGKLVSAYYST